MREIELPEGYTLTPAGARVGNLAVLDLFAQLKKIEDEDGGWNGADTVDVVYEWFRYYGVDVDRPLHHYVVKPGADES